MTRHIAFVVRGTWFLFSLRLPVTPKHRSTFACINHNRSLISTPIE